MVKALMKKLDMNEKGFALLMNVAPSTVRLWTSGAAQGSG
jgi:putative transcriptional regulator